MDNERTMPFTTKELAAAAGVNQSRIRQLLISGELAGYKQGRDWFIPVDVARQYIEERQAKQDKS